jgi:hypothetical protein
MSSDIPRSAHSEMDARADLATEFFEITHAELIPFVSDEATWYDFDYLDIDDLARVLQSHYGLKLNESILALPFWKLLDFLDESRISTGG